MDAARLLDYGHEPLRTCIVNALVLRDARRFGEGRRDERPGFLRARCGRDEGEIGNKAMTRHIGADHRCVGAAAFDELAIAIVPAGLGALGFCMAEQHKTTHRGNVAFRSQIV